MTEPAELAWRETWHSHDALNLRIEEADVPTSTGPRAVRRIRCGANRTGAPGAGAVVVAVRHGSAGEEIAFVEQYRRAPGVTLWELPRGVVDATDPSLLATGVRELHEETALEALEPMLLGPIYADSGLIADPVQVVSCRVAPEATGWPLDGEVEQVRWVSVVSIGELVRDGRLRDGISLAALGLYRACGTEVRG